ncbi:MAG: succinate dehydrogenase, cytochrome b556 subunit [Candidatus Omnitrophica bacterium]|nr:succinate dehydrogenase, cytochrome b556 subunit [Candidatus Omnitrophota bacterium]
MMYRGKVGMWSWALHRATGVGVLLFLFIHIIDTAFIIFGPEAYNHLVSLYKQAFFRPLEVGLLAALLYHSLNGIRICLIDFWPTLARFQERLFYGVMVLFFLLFIPASYLMVRSLF